MDVANDWQGFTLNTSFSRHSLPVGSCGPSCSPEQLMLQVHVSFPSGYGETLALPPNSTVGDLKVLVQKTFRQGFLRLVTEKGHVLANHEDSLLAAGIPEGMHLTVVAQKPKVAATSQAFAVWCCGGDRIATWGEQCYGGDSSAVQDHLKNVQQVQGTMGAFAAILADGSVVTCGDRNSGGDSSAVQDQLKNVQQIQATGTVFAAILADGSVITWGNQNFGGDSSAVQDQLKNVQQVQGTRMAFAAILADGSVITWSHPFYGPGVTALQFKISSRMSSRCKAQAWLLLPS